MQMTEKDQLRMSRLMEHTARYGLRAGLEKAERDAAKIETLSKCSARAGILEAHGHARLADVFRSRYAWLIAQGVRE